MNYGIVPFVSSNNRNFSSYEEEYRKLDFEPTQESYRLRRILELISVHNLTTTRRVLEIGPGRNSLFQFYKETWVGTILEPMPQNYQQLSKVFIEHPNISIIDKTIEQLGKDNKQHFDLIILSSVLHEIPNYRKALEEICLLLENEGILLIVVPNAESIHRQIGVNLGIISDLFQLSSTQSKMQQGIVFSIDTLTNLVADAKFEVLQCITSFVKPLTHKQMQDRVDSGVISDEDLETLYNLSAVFEPFGSEIFLIAKKCD